ncbi:hypothetical protein [Streptomyces sp. NPDC059134]|uniref:hypothetical protein n=1 Tax=Streptomyces sp. NPDC059134 TaxID=3346738 RepID=UPI0036CD6594
MAQPAAASARAFFSVVSVLSCQWILVAIQSAMYRQRYPVKGGSQVAGSWSSLDRLVFAETAIRLLAASRWLA